MGRGTVGGIPQIVREARVQKAQIVTDEGLVAAGVVARVTQVLDDARIAYSIYDGVEPNPPVRNVEACAAQYRAENCDFLLAIGGGSSMDVAKTAGVLVAHGGNITDYFIGGKPVPGPIPFLLCVPTTYGTASEVTPFAGDHRRQPLQRHCARPARHAEGGHSRRGHGRCTAPAHCRGNRHGRPHARH